MAEDLIVADENFYMASETIKNYGNFLEFHLGVYEWILTQVANDAIRDERITEKIQSILENLRGIKETIKSAAETVGEYSNSFIEAIDEADQFLYGDG